MTIKVRISPTLAYDYEMREVYDFITKPGTYHLTREQADELRQDAEYFVFHTDMTPANYIRAYAALASNLRAALNLV